MALGGFIEADRRLVAHERMMRRHHKMKKDAAIWRSYEEDFERQGKEMPVRQPQAIAAAVKEGSKEK